MDRKIISCLAAAFVLGFQVLHAEIQVSGSSSSSSDSKTPSGDSSADDRPQTDSLKFFNSDILHGTLVSANPESSVIWRHPDAEKQIDFKIANIREISLGARSGKAADGLVTAVHLTNGDVVKGNLVSLDNEKLLLKTSFAGELKITRPMIKGIYPSSVSNSIYEGPNEIKEWTVENRGSSKVAVSNKTLILPGNTSAGRDMKLPEMAKIEFELSSTQNLQFNLFLYSDQIARHQGSSYILNLSSSYLYIQRYTRNEGSDNIGQGECRGLRDKAKCRIAVLVNKKTKSFTVLVNGNVAQQMTDSKNDFAGKGTAVCFGNNSSSGLKIKNIQISKWDGRIPTVGAAAEAAADVKDNILFSNDDKVTGKLKGIENGQISFETEFAVLTVPMERVKNIITSSAGAQTARRNTNDMRAYFENDEYVTVNLVKISDGKVAGGSENFGNTEFNLGAFKKLSFNIYNEAAEQKDSGAADEDGE